MSRPSTPPDSPRGHRAGGRVRGRIEGALERRLEELLAPIRQRLDTQHRRIAKLERQLGERLPQAVEKANRATNELQRLEPQLASLEQRLEELRQRYDTRIDPGTGDEQAEAARLVDLVRREHEQIRARMTAISWYEERLRRLEERAGAGDSPGDPPLDRPTEP
jgi:DNA repair exonuclease SbcCD ATPase subunit